MNWKKFLDEIEKEPKNFAKAIIENLNPPKYAVEMLKGFNWICDFCWNPRVDCCFVCMKGICQEHIAKVFIGEKTKLEWYVCPDCLKSHGESEVLQKTRDQDEEFWVEDQRSSE